MFLAGLEMDMDDFKKNRTKGLIFGMFTFLIDGAGHMEQHEYAGLWIFDFCVAGQYVCQSHLDCLSYYQRYGLSRQRTVSITIGGTAVTVVLALMVLAVIGGMYKGEDVGGTVLGAVGCQGSFAVRTYHIFNASHQPMVFPYV